MKMITYLLFLCPLISFSQNITKKELKNLIKERIKINNSDGESYTDLSLFTDNKDSLFFSKKEFTVYVNRGEKEPFYCRKISFEFINQNEVEFQDIQICSEPTFSYATAENKRFIYKITKEKKNIFIVFENRFSKKKYKIIDTKRTNKNKITEFTLTEF